MTFCVENETDICFPFDIREVAESVALEVLAGEGCPFEAQIGLIVADNGRIRDYNRQFRQIDKETDVLSFPNIDFERPACFDGLAERKADHFDPETGELMLGDIIISAQKVEEQAQCFGHSLKREFAFLVAHSMLHLCGYDHMEPGEASVMEQKQEQVLAGLGILREESGI